MATPYASESARSEAPDERASHDRGLASGLGSWPNRLGHREPRLAATTGRLDRTDAPVKVEAARPASSGAGGLGFGLAGVPC